MTNNVRFYLAYNEQNFWVYNIKNTILEQKLQIKF